MTSVRHNLAVQLVPLGGANPLTAKIVTSGLVIGTAGIIAIQASGGVGPYSFLLTTGSLPPGMGTLGATTGISSGTPSASGTYTFTVQVTDSTPSTPLTITVRVTLTVANPLTYSQKMPVAVNTNLYSQQVVVSGATGVVTFTVPASSHGLSLSSSGLITGTATTAGAASFSATATDAGTGASLAITVSVAIAPLPLALTPTSTWNVVAGQANSRTLSVGNGTGAGPYSLTTISPSNGPTFYMNDKGSIFSSGGTATMSWTPDPTVYVNAFTNLTLQVQITDGYGDTTTINLPAIVANKGANNRAQLDTTNLGSAGITNFNVTSTNGLKATANATTMTFDANVASSSQPGMLSSSDWTTFNGKQSTVSVAAFGASPNSNGVSFSGGVFTMQPAATGFPGGVSTTTQSFDGAKTFNNNIAAANISAVGQINSGTYNHAGTFFQASGGAIANIGQGYYVTWNQYGSGSTDFVNHHGLGAGGWTFVNYDGTTATLVAQFMATTFELQVPNVGSVAKALGTVGATATVDARISRVTTMTQTSATALTITVTNPSNPGDFFVRVAAPAAGSLAALAWSVTALKGATALPVSFSALGKVHLIHFVYDGTNTWYKADTNTLNQ